MNERHPASPGRARLRASLAAWLPAVAIAALIFAMSSMSGDELPTFDRSWVDMLPLWLAERVDKVVHATIYAVLGAASFRATSRGLGPRRRLAALAALALCAAYGASDEWHQAFVPGRTPDVFDWLADVTGALGGITALGWLAGRRAPLPSDRPAAILRS